MNTLLSSVRSFPSFDRNSTFVGAAALAVLLSGVTASAGDVFILENFPGNSLRSFPVNDPTNQTLIGAGTPTSFVLEFNTPGTILWGIDENAGAVLGTFDTTNAAFTPIAPVVGILAGHTLTGLSMDPTDGTLYLSTTDVVVSTIYRLNPATAVATPVGNAAGLAHIDIAIDCLGQMYAHDILTDSLYTVDKTTGASTLIGPTGFDANNAQGMDFDYSDGTLYATLFDSNAFGTQFVTFDLTTGAATPLAFAAGEEFEMAVRGPCVAGQDRAGPSEKGSLLVYPNIEVRWENVPPFNLIQDTFVHLTNDYPGNVDVKLFYFNGDPPIFSAYWDGDPETDLEGLGGLVGMLREDPGTSIGQAGNGDGARDHPGWNSFDNIIQLTANEPAYWAASTGLPKGVGPWMTLDPGPPPGRPDPDDPEERYIRGFIVAFAIDRVSGEEIRWNHLAGDATIVNYPREEAWQYGAPAFQVVNASIANGQPTGTPGALFLNGFEYAQAPAELLLNFVASDAEAYSGDRTITHDTDLSLMPVYWDFRQETVGPRTTKASFDIWNENEVKFTNLDRCVTCWDQEVLSNHAVPNHFLIGHLHTNAGKARINGLASFLCPESVETSLLGVAAKLMYLDLCCDGDRIASGTNLTSLGREDGLLLFDTSGPPPESRWETSSLK